MNRLVYRIFQVVTISTLTTTAASSARSQSASPAPSVSSGMFSFQDSTLGEQFATWRSSHSAIPCRPGEIQNETICEADKPSFITRFGSVNYYFYQVTPQSSPVLYKIQLLASNTDEAVILDGLTGKWGEPQAGLAVDYVWKKAKSTIVFAKLVGGVVATYTDDATARSYEKDKNSAAAKAF